ncbi:MAG: serine hydrolase domain-containing protein [Promethearchaeota archaeon]
MNTAVSSNLIHNIDIVFKKIDKENTPGCALAIVKHGDICYKKGYGMANLEYGIPITPQTIFHVASVSKQFTAFSILLLEQENKLSLKDEIQSYLSDIPQCGKKITIQHLLNHTSGLRSQFGLLRMAGWRLDDVITQSDILNIVKQQQELNYEPGSKFLYSNTGYTLLAEIVSTVSGKKFKDFTNLKIFIPLEMEQTHFHHDHQQIVKNRAYSYGLKNRKIVKNILNFANVGATSLFTTVEDLAKWDKNFYTGKVGGKIVLKKMVQKGVLNNGREIVYANGLSIKKYRGLDTVEHGGADAGFRAYFIRFPNQQTTIICFSNFGRFRAELKAKKIADIILKKDIEKIPKVKLKTKQSKIKIPYEIIGLYGVKNTLLLLIAFQDGQFYVSFDFINPLGLPNNPLTPKGDFLFQDIEGGEYAFQDFDDKRFQSVYLSGLDLIAKRLVPKDVSHEKLLEFTGKYYSHELESVYNFSIKEDQLIIIPPRGEPTKLLYLGNDIFRNWLQFIKFKRDEQNNVKSFRISEGRIKNLKFERMV